MERIFYPQSIVVIGVSERPENLAQNIIRNLSVFGYQGKIYAVGRREGQVHGVPIVDSLERVPDGLDLAVILTPAAMVPGLMETCGRKGIQRLVIESGGFSEFSPEGRQLEEQLKEIARQRDMHFVGPNCISVVNLENGVCLPFATISPQNTFLGPASVIAQSGGISISYLVRLCLAGVGANKVISIGNKADLDEADYLAYLLEDSGTETICLYLESIGDGRHLMSQARVSSKPIIIHKANRGRASQAVAFSHTAALADDDRLVSAAFRQAGILRADSIHDAVAMAQGLALPPVRGNNLVVISRSGGHAVIAADMAERYGFELTALPEEFAQQVRGFFRADVISLTNPLDLGVIFDFDLYAQIVENCLRAISPDAVLLVNTYSLREAEAARELAWRVKEIVQDSGRPIAFCAYSQGDDTQEIQRETGMPIFAEIEGAIRGLAASRNWHRWRALQQEEPRVVPSVSVHPEPRPSLEAGVATADKVFALCQAYGIPVAGWEVVADAESAAQAAERIGLPVALKILSSQATHKSDVGGVILNIPDAATVGRQAQALLSRSVGAESAPDSSALMVQQMIEGGVEVILGGKRDHAFGPVVMFGVGGIFVEIFDDVAFRIAPISRIDAESMIEEVRGKRLLEGLRGQSPVDREALVQAILSFSRLLVENPFITEVEINPLIVTEHGAVAVDARALIVDTTDDEGTER